MKITISLSTEDDGLELAGVLREADRLELELSGYPDALEAILLGVRSGTEAFTVRFDGKIAAIYGVTQTAPAIASVWMLGSDELRRAPWRWLRIARQSIDRWHRTFALLQNIVHADHTASLRMLGWLGFNFGDPFPHGPCGALFVPFWK